LPVSEDLITSLYEAPPEKFVAGRAAAIADARRDGDKEAAKRYAALRKPTVAAWLVNLLALRRPELIDDLVELSTALREAQRGLQGDQLRELSQQRRQVVAALVAAARQLAVDDDPALGGAKLPLGEVESTLTAAMAEPEVAEQVRSGRLVRAATYAGFGEVPRPRLRLVTAEEVEGDEEEEEEEVPEVETPQRAAAERRRREQEERRRELRRDLKSAEAAEGRADEQLDRAEAAERDAGHVVEDLDAELAELERRRTEAVADVARRKLARRTAEREAAAARRRVGDVQAALEDLDADGKD
jgi:DNA repair exonuclease SbcCD ATPase subunit